jgi:hypothetical protein
MSIYWYKHPSVVINKQSFSVFGGNGPVKAVEKTPELFFWYTLSS